MQPPWLNQAPRPWWRRTAPPGSRFSYELFKCITIVYNKHAFENLPRGIQRKVGMKENWERIQQEGEERVDSARSLRATPLQRLSLCRTFFLALSKLGAHPARVQGAS
jgi:hypothetical protein